IPKVVSGIQNRDPNLESGIRNLESIAPSSSRSGANPRRKTYHENVTNRRHGAGRRGAGPGSPYGRITTGWRGRDEDPEHPAGNQGRPPLAGSLGWRRPGVAEQGERRCSRRRGPEEGI